MAAIFKLVASEEEKNKLVTSEEEINDKLVPADDIERKTRKISQK